MMLEGHHCIALEEESTEPQGLKLRHMDSAKIQGRLVGYTLIADSWYTRNPSARRGESSLVINEAFRSLSTL